jgi:isomaltose glucohydrolase
MADEVLSTSDDLAAVSLEIIAAGQVASGAFLAGPTFSQYRYSWLRDGSFIAEALDLAGAHERSARFHHWVARIVSASAEGLDRARATARRGSVPHETDYLHCRYTADGATADGDWPTFQLDGPGIWLWGLGRHVELAGSIDGELSSAAAIVARYLADLWPIPCADAWEEFEDQVHTSTLAAIAAGLRAASSMWSELAADKSIKQARAAIDARLSEGTGALTKWPGNPEVDGSLLWLAAPYEYLAPEHHRFAATLARIEAELISDGVGVHRYRSDTFYGGGAWPVLSSAYGRVLLRRDGPGDIDHARRILHWIEAQANEAGALPEQVAEHALAPHRLDEWRDRWGESANPLLWSHAAYLALRIELEQHQARTAALG